jgi:hypothetical protein
MPRYGYGISLNRRGGVQRSCDITTYFNGSANFNISFIGLFPFTGDIYSGATLIGNRSAVTKSFTPDAGVPTADLISDTTCLTNPLVINELTDIAVTNDLTNNFIVNEV